MKKLTLYFAMILIIILFSLTASAAEIVDSGECGLKGDNVKWTLDADGLVTISGEGSMAYYDFYEKNCSGRCFVRCGCCRQC